LYHKIYHLKGEERIDDEIDHFNFSSCWGRKGTEKFKKTIIRALALGGIKTPQLLFYLPNP